MRIRVLLFAVMLASGLAGFAAPALAAEVSPPEISWQMVGPDMVRFHVTFHNSSPTEPTGGVRMEMFSQEFGTFLPDYGMLAAMDIPPIEPESFFDVYLDVPLSALPPSAGWKPAGYDEPQRVGCLPPTWNGNVDVHWAGPGGVGQVNKHYGQLGVCPGGGPACIHTMTGCIGNITWATRNVCQGWTVVLVNEDFSPAPALLPPGWTGHICATADNTVPVGTQCCFSVDMTCGGVTASIDVCAFAECVTPLVPRTWSHIKTLHP